MAGLPGKNPYRPGAATPPLHLAGREPQLSRFPKLLRAAPEIPANMRLTGLRGVGKSVLLKEFEAVARAEGWAVVRHQVELRHNTEEAVNALLAAALEAAKARLSRARRVKATMRHPPADRGWRLPGLRRPGPGRRDSHQGPGPAAPTGRSVARHRRCRRGDLGSPPVPAHRPGLGRRRHPDGWGRQRALPPTAWAPSRGLAEGSFRTTRPR